MNKTNKPFRLIVVRPNGSQEHFWHFTAKSARQQAKRLAGLLGVRAVQLSGPEQPLVTLWAAANT